jgi:hypothetical protein
MRRCTLTRQGLEGHWYNTDTDLDGRLEGSRCSRVKGSRNTGAKCDLKFQIQVWRSTAVCTPFHHVLVERRPRQHLLVPRVVNICSVQQQTGEWHRCAATARDQGSTRTPGGRGAHCLMHACAPPVRALQDWRGALTNVLHKLGRRGRGHRQDHAGGIGGCRSRLHGHPLHEEF